ncbi:RluA family pseudouridine synthase [Candidatus Woesebacteria bacterium]|nr:RluA family pseudouridine synthase [Candidatus Woesebacteria bacterium]
MLEIEILFEDTDLAVINKPSGITVNNASTNRGETIQQWWQSYLISQEIPQSSSEWNSLIPAHFSMEYGSPEEIFSQRGGIVHRLDKDTSGALLLAKNPGSLVNLLAQFKERSVKKTYRALVHGRLGVQRAELNYPTMRSSRERQKMFVHPDGRPSVTAYAVVAEYQDPTQPTELLSMVECLPKTGRMHQIRVHFAHIRHPLVSDRLYAGRNRYKQDITWCPRHFLHASSIEFTHPRTKQVVRVEAPLPDDLRASLDLLQKYTS